jgi:hypothetical protein
MRKFRRTNELDGSTFARELSPLALTGGLVINQDRSLARAMRLDAPYTPTLADEGIEGVYSALGGFLNALPAHFDLQVIWTQHARTAEFSARLDQLGCSGSSRRTCSACCARASCAGSRST